MKQKRILVVDDDEDIIETVTALLEYEGFTVEASLTIEEGLSVIKTDPPDLVLLDVMFPEKKTRGFEAAEEIKNIQPKLPLFIFTAINREYAFDFSKDDIKADEFINKPISTEILLSLIRKYI